ncbi:MAG TPA: zf-TFIIB domain-containing protein [Tepidisphaeraceae bacterium]|jgi:hypothetical protein
MNCPHCNTTLNLAERQGVEIDVCPTCRGVWLDRGELDKIIERYGMWDEEQYQRPRTTKYQHHQKRKGFWQELFD